MGTTHEGHASCIEVFLLEHLLHCELDISHILVAHIAWERKDAVLAKASGATIVH